MVLKPEDRRPARRAVAAYPLEHRGAELHGMRKDVNLCVRPANEFAVPPDPVRLGEFGHERPGVRDDCAELPTSVERSAVEAVGPDQTDGSPRPAPLPPNPAEPPPFPKKR